MFEYVIIFSAIPLHFQFPNMKGFSLALEVLNINHNCIAKKSQQKGPIFALRLNLYQTVSQLTLYRNVIVIATLI